MFHRGNLKRPSNSKEPIIISIPAFFILFTFYILNLGVADLLFKTNCGIFLQIISILFGILCCRFALKRRGKSTTPVFNENTFNHQSSIFSTKNIFVNLHQAPKTTQYWSRPDLRARIPAFLGGAQSRSLYNTLAKPLLVLVPKPRFR